MIAVVAADATPSGLPRESGYGRPEKGEEGI